MHVAVRSYLTAGVALVGAGAIAVSPVMPVPPESLTATTQSVTVDLAAATNPIAAWTQVLNDAIGNVTAIGGAVLDDPAPILRQVITNDVGYATSVATGLTGAIGGLITSLTSSDPGTIRGALETVIDDINAGEYQQAGLDAINVVYGFVAVAFGLISVLQIPTTITQNIADATSAAVGALVGGAILPVLGTLQGTFAAAGDSAQAVADSLSNGDIGDAVLNLVNTPATLTGALLNGYTYDFNGTPATSWGLISYDPATFKVGSIPALLVSLPRAIRDAIKPDPALTATSTGTTVTLDVAADPVAEKLTTKDDATATAAAAAADEPKPDPTSPRLVRKGLVATPGDVAVKKVSGSVSGTVDSAVSKLTKGLKNGFAKPAKTAKHAKHAKGAKADSSGGDS